MGCVFPKPVAVNENFRSNIFRVVNIDQDGNDHLPGKIEITDDDLLLHQKKKQLISWPIRTLRRYGYDRNIFSFEAGRRCPTGEGIFAFRCDEAEQLFRLLQLKIQRNSGNATTGQTENTSLEPRIVHLESTGSPNDYPCTPVLPQTSFCNQAFDSKSNTDSVLALPNGKPISVPGSPLYINMPNNTDGDLENESLPRAPYLFLTEKYEKPCPSPLILPSPSFEFGVEELSPNNLQYITLELGDKSTSPSSMEGERSPGYTTIDFQKTWALVQSTKPNAENDVGCTRRTRHNSTLY